MVSLRSFGPLILLFAMVLNAHGQSTTTQAATGVTDIAATLRGSVTPGTGIYSDYQWCWFDFGTTTDYGQTINADHLTVSGTSPVAVAASPPGLQPNTTYHYRVRLGTILSLYYGGLAGDDMTFTTGPPATLPTFQSVNSDIISDTAANFDVWGANSGGSAATVSIEYGADATYGSVFTFPDTMPMNTSVSFQQARLTGLSPVTTYHWRLKLTNGQGNTYSADQSFTTLGTPVVTTGTASNVTYTSVRLDGSVDPAGHTLSVVFQYGTSTNYASSVIASPAQVSTPGTNAVFATFSGLIPGTTYHYRLKVTDAWNGGDVYVGDDQTFSTPSRVVTLPATGVTDLNAVLNGTMETFAGGFIPVFDLGTTTAYGTVLSVSSSQTDPNNPQLRDVSVSPPNLVPSTTYHYRLRAYQAFDLGTDMTFTTGPPATSPVVTQPSSSNISATGVTLSVTVQSGSSPTTTAFDYGTDTSYGSTASFPFIQSTNTTSTNTKQNLSGLTPGTTYHWRARSTNNEGVATSPDQTFTTLPIPSVTTSPATNVGSTWATFNGSYNAQGGTYTVAFEFGADTNYGTTVDPATGNATGAIGGGGIIILGGGLTIHGGGVIIGGNGSNAPGNTHVTIVILNPNATYHYRLKLTDGTGNAVYGTDATFSTLTGVQAWRQNYFGSTDGTGNTADLAMPLGDGVPNLLKYALGLEPSKPGVEPAPAALTYNDNSTRLSLTFTRLIFASDLTYEVQGADDVTGPWSTIASASGGLSFSVGPFGDPGLVTELSQLVLQPGLNGYPTTTSTVTVFDTVPMSEATRRFMRLKVTR